MWQLYIEKNQKKKNHLIFLLAPTLANKFLAPPLLTPLIKKSWGRHGL